MLDIIHHVGQRSIPNMNEWIWMCEYNVINHAITNVKQNTFNELNINYILIINLFLIKMFFFVSQSPATNHQQKTTYQNSFVMTKVMWHSLIHITNPLLTHSKHLALDKNKVTLNSSHVWYEKNQATSLTFRFPERPQLRPILW